jgi:hypothetical protein
MMISHLRQARNVGLPYPATPLLSVRHQLSTTRCTARQSSVVTATLKCAMDRRWDRRKHVRIGKLEESSRLVSALIYHHRHESDWQVVEVVEAL